MASSAPEIQTSIEFAHSERPGMPSWIGSPFRLLRFPGVLAAVVGAALIVAVATAAGPLFLSAAGTAALGQNLTQAAQRAPALQVVGYGPVSRAFLDPPDRALTSAVSGIPEVAPPLLSVVTNVSVSGAGGRANPQAVQLVARTGFLSHVHASGAPTASGVWLSAKTAHDLGIEAGQNVRFQSGADSAEAPVAGTYQDLSTGPLDPYWRPLRDALQGSKGSAPLPTVLTDVDTIAALGEQLHGTGRAEWDFGLRITRMTLPQAQSVAGRLGAIREEAGNVHTSLGGSFQTDRFATSPPFATSPITSVVAQAARISDGIRGPVETISLAGRILALLGMAAAGVYGVRRRRIEASLLASRGVPPLVQGAFAMVESVLPAAVAAVAGWALAIVLVKALGPTTFIPTSAQLSALVSTGVMVGIGLVLLGAAAALAVRVEFDEVAGRLPRSLSRAPWEAVVLILAAASFYEISARGSAAVSSGGVPHVDRLLLLFPLLFIAGVSGVIVRALRAGLGRIRGSGSKWRTPAYLALRRLASTPRMALLLVTASALAVGILVYAAMLSESIATTTREKALVATGSDVSVPLAASAGVPTSLPFPTTLVAEIDQSSVEPSERPVQVLAIDPRTFAAAAFWDPRFSGTPLAELLQGLQTNGVRMPAVAAGFAPPSSGDLILRLQGGDAPIHVVGTAASFPGMRAGRGTVVVDRATLLRAVPSVNGLTKNSVRLWAKGDPSTILSALRAKGVPVAGAATAERLGRTPAFLAVTWTFSFLEALGIVAALVALVGLILYLQSRQLSREVSYALSRRMGLSPRSHRWSMVLELGGMLLGAFVVGALLAAAAARLVYRKLDLLPTRPPAPIYELPLPVLGLIVLVLGLAAVVGAAAAQRRAARANVAEVMRLAG
jgi:putative ABC transport system permease protein